MWNRYSQTRQPRAGFCLPILAATSDVLTSRETLSWFTTQVTIDTPSGYVKVTPPPAMATVAELQVPEKKS
jgi:hypothetical protein